MNRVRASALVLVNWNGVFYERYALDRQVTALEGDNGTGKTTVMIGAYVTLLPDMHRLRFTNLGESAATGGDKGIWGRLGERGRPSYAALDFVLPGPSRVVAGVQLLRESEPTVKPAPFIVTGLPENVRLQDLFLLQRGPSEQVPELPELKENAAKLGGVLKPFPSAKEYLSALFDLGILAMRMGTDEERAKFNEMLKTSMTGGMSKGLLSELRSFLLKEEGGLADTVQTMRANLDACRRTRSEVEEARLLEREIGGVYEAGETMFVAAVAATREWCDEMTRRATDAASARIQAEDAHHRAMQALDEIVQQLHHAKEEETQAGGRLETARDLLGRVEQAVRWAGILKKRLQAVQTAEGALVIATTCVDRSRSEKDHRERQLDSARLARERAAAGLADLQKGLEELHRRADGHRQVTLRLAETRARLGLADLEGEQAEGASEEAEKLLREVDNERRALQRRVDDAEAHRAEHAEALVDLQTIEGREVDPQVAWKTAGPALERVREWRQKASSLSRLLADLAAAEEDVRRQEMARITARDLGLDLRPEVSATQVLEGALADVDRDLQSAQGRRNCADQESRDAQKTIDDTRRVLQELEGRRIRYLHLAETAMRVATVAQIPLSDAPSLGSVRAVLQTRAQESSARLSEMQSRREDILREARQLRVTGGVFPQDLLKLRDDLAADLLASRLDDVSVEEAGPVEARLGPLVHALVVADPQDVVERVQRRGETLPTVWLVPEDTSFRLDPDATVGPPGRRDVVLREGEAWRVTRIPATPTLGRKAREQRAAALVQEAQGFEPRIRAAREELLELEKTVKEADVLLAGQETWLAGDTTPDIDAARKREAEAVCARDAARAEAEAARVDTEGLRARIASLQRLLPDARLLDPPDQDERSRRLAREVAEAKRAVADLARVGSAPERLSLHLEALRRLPLSGEEVVEFRSRLSVLDARRDSLREGIETARYVTEHLGALSWSDAEPKLRAEQALVPALQAQLDRAVAALREADTAWGDAQKEWDDARSAWNTADADLKSARNTYEEASEELERTGIENPSLERLSWAQEEVETARSDLAVRSNRHGALLVAMGNRETQEHSERRALEQACEREARENDAARPAQSAWERLRPQVESHGLLERTTFDRLQMETGGGGSVNLRSRAQAERRVLEDRLGSARGGAEILKEVRRVLVAGDQPTGETYLQAWLLVRGWLLRHLPARIADVDEPLVALARLKEELGTLCERLERQEQDLRGESEDVARGIEVQIRKAHGQVRRLNRHLEKIRFGAIHGIRVRPQPVERMANVLRALREGATQELLFQARMPVEEALDAIFAQYGGGRSGGQKILDYREYLHLQVEVLRQGRQDWEAVNPAQLSTGEAIGVGAALMMVVLTEWELDANLLRGRRAAGCLRFLFLDEANRLDARSLGTVFDLCRKLDLQLLLAAPEVEQSEGCTVYRLVRVPTSEGREEVRVTGRRVVAEG